MTVEERLSRLEQEIVEIKSSIQQIETILSNYREAYVSTISYKQTTMRIDSVIQDMNQTINDILSDITNIQTNCC